MQFVIGSQNDLAILEVLTHKIQDQTTPSKGSRYLLSVHVHPRNLTNLMPQIAISKGSGKPVSIKPHHLGARARRSLTRECTLKQNAKLICTEGLLLDYPEALEWSDPMVIMACDI